jgi:hypothetical protein
VAAALEHKQSLNKIFIDNQLTSYVWNVVQESSKNLAVLTFHGPRQQRGVILNICKKKIVLFFKSREGPM